MRTIVNRIAVLAIALMQLAMSAPSSPAQEVRKPYQTSATHTCTADFSCTLLFAPVAAQRRIELSRASCLMRTVKPLAQAYLFVDTSPSVIANLVPGWIRAVGPSDTYYYTFDQATGLFAISGKRFIVNASSAYTTTFEITCNLFGELVVLP